jgi:hypothetical protein
MRKGAMNESYNEIDHGRTSSFILIATDQKRFVDGRIVGGDVSKNPVEVFARPVV